MEIRNDLNDMKNELRVMEDWNELWDLKKILKYIAKWKTQGHDEIDGSRFHSHT